MSTQIATDIIVTGIFYLAAALTVWFGWHWWIERRWTIALLAGTYLALAIQFGRVAVAYVWRWDGWDYGTWPSLLSSLGILILLLIVVMLAVVGKLTRTVQRSMKGGIDDD